LGRESARRKASTHTGQHNTEKRGHTTSLRPYGHWDRREDNIKMNFKNITMMGSCEHNNES